METFGHIRLNGKQYRIDLQSYRKKDLADFSPRASVPGGAITQSELLLYQPLNMTDWRHGCGFIWFTDAAGYLRTEGNVDTRYPGIVTLYSAANTLNDAQATALVKYGMCAFNAKTYAWGEQGLLVLDTDVWSDIYTTTVYTAMPTSPYLFFSAKDTRLQKMATDGTISVTGADTNAENYAWMYIYSGKAYAGKVNSNQVHYATEEDLSDMEGTSDDPETLYIGSNLHPTVRAIGYAGNLYIAKYDGLWQVTETGIATRVLDYSNEADAHNFKAMTIYNGYLYFNIGRKLYQWNGARISDVTPPRLTDKFPYVEVCYVRSLTSVGGFMYAIVAWKHDTVPTYRNTLMAWDGVGWHKLADLSTTVLGINDFLFYNPNGNRMWVYQHANAPSTSELIQYFNISDVDFPYENFPTTGYNYLYSPRLDMGYRRVYKSTPSILVEASNCSTNAYIRMQGALDSDSDFYWWGDVTSDGVTELTPVQPASSDPDITGWASTTGSIQYKYMILRWQFVTTASTTTPILEGTTVRFLMRPDTFYGFNFNVIAARDYDFNTYQDNRDVTTILADLEAARDSKEPVEYIDPFGVTRHVYLSSVTQSAVEYHEDEENGTENIEHVVNINLVEVK